MNHTVNWREYVVHIPTPDAFGDEARARAELLQHVRYFLVVGSLRRPAKIAKMASERMGLRHVGTYFDILRDSAVGDREYNIEVVDLGVEDDGDPAHVAVVSHGIGGSGAEIVLVELAALVRLVRKELGLDVDHRIEGVGRSGTRGTLGEHDYGLVGISTASFDDNLDVALPDPDLLHHVVAAADESPHPSALGAGVSTRFFWHGQGRVVPSQGSQGVDIRLRDRREAEAESRLWEWVERGIEFVEMEDYAVHLTAARLGIPSVSAGSIAARRFDVKRGEFVLDYSIEAKKRAELWPAEVILGGFQRHWAARAERNAR